MKKVLFGITSLSLGGAERVLVDLCNELSNKYDITIFTIYANGELEKQLFPNIKIQSLIDKRYTELTKKEKILKPIEIMLFKNYIYKKYIKKDYDVEIAFLEGPVTRLFSCKNSNTKKIAWIHNDITKVFGNGFKASLKRKIDKHLYEKFSNLIFVSRDNQEKFEEEYNLDTQNQVIYNYINTKSVIEKSKENMDIIFNPEETNIVTVSRLVSQKAIDRLIKVHKRIIDEGINHNIYVVGDGPEKQNLEKLIEENNVKQTFKLIGAKENPYPYIKNANAFALLSYFEGYPMVLLEAKILKKYIIITDTAARETLQNYSNSLILDNDEDAIFVGLCKYLKMRKDIEKEINNIDDYNNSDIIKQVEELIEE